MSEQQQHEQRDPYEGHTPGPWGREDGDGLLIEANGAPIARVYDASDYPCIYDEAEIDHVNTEAEANADLIADAPKLLAQTREQAAELAALRERAERAERERDALVAAWPSSEHHTVFHAQDPEGWILWGADDDNLVHPTREAAIRAAAGLDDSPAPEPTP